MQASGEGDVDAEEGGAARSGGVKSEGGSEDVKSKGKSDGVKAEFESGDVEMDGGKAESAEAASETKADGAADVKMEVGEDGEGQNGTADMDADGGGDGGGGGGGGDGDGDGDGGDFSGGASSEHPSAASAPVRAPFGTPGLGRVFVEFEDEEAAAECARAMDGRYFDGRR
eukprot:5283353-Pleurochrysis_carterae.AAC.1